MAVLRDVYQYPHPDYLPDEQGYPRLVHEADAAFEAFLRAAEKFRAAIPTSDHWYVMQHLLAQRLEPSRDPRLLAELEKLLEKLPRLAELSPRQIVDRRRVRHVNDVELRLITQAVCWYVVNVEHRRITIHFAEDDGSPKSRSARLIAATCHGMGLAPAGSKIETHLRQVKKLGLERLPRENLIRVLHPPKRSKTASD